MRLSTHSVLRAGRALGCRWGVAGSEERRGNVARILMLHGTPRSRADALESCLRYLQRLFRIVPLRDVVASAGEGHELHRKVALTFDDGLRNSVQVAYPLLRRLGLSATFFVCPQLVEEDRWLWNHEARQRTLRLSPAELAPLARELDSEPEVEALVERMKGLPLAARQAAEAHLRRLTPRFESTEAEREAFELAGWDELRRLDPDTVTIGSHTLTHPILTTLDAPDLEREIVGSRTMLEAKLDRPVDEFAYPNGGVDAVAAGVARRTYGCAVTTAPGYAKPHVDPILIPRISMSLDPLRLALALHAPLPIGL